MAGMGSGATFRHLRDLFKSGSVAGLGDGALLARYAGSEDGLAFEALVVRHGPMVLATCRAVLHNEHDVEDAFQATFLVLARRAGSVRGGESLGGWLHRVAYRASVEASVAARKRSRKEAEAAATVRPGSREAEHELAALLHEEVGRLPEGQRLPVVLCDLEGLTYEQAAEQLRWTVATVHHRLADGRKRLKDRLARRGFTGAWTAPSVAVPPSLSRMTIAAATGGGSSKVAAMLAHNLLRGMMMTKIKIVATVALAALALAPVGWMAAAGMRGDPGGTAREQEPRAKVAADRAPAAEPPRPAGTTEIRGRVVAPDGRPIAGAIVRSQDLGDGERPGPEATSDAEGRFAINLPDAGSPRSGFWATYPRLVASSPGLGVGWADRVLRADRPSEQVVRLSEAGPAIEGRVVDLEGRPVGGARVEPARIWFDPEGGLAGWLARARAGSIASVGQDLESVPVAPLASMAATTGPDGRFRLLGIGPDRLADLLVSGPTIATAQVSVMTRDEPEIRAPRREMSGPTQFVVLTPGPEIAAAPGRIVEGVARDKDNGRAIAGLEIRAGVASEPYGMFRVEGVRASTDAQGRYRLAGLPAATAYRLFVSAGPGLPYTDGLFEAPAASKPGPTTFDFALKRGVLVRGKVLDRASGKPVRGSVFALALGDNPHVAETPGYAAYLDLQSARIGADGGYEIAALPGPGLLAVIDQESRHRPAGGLEGMKGYDAQMGGFSTSFAPIPASGYHLFVATDFPVEAGTATVDLPLDPGRTATIEVVDGAGRPLGGTKVVGAGAGRRQSVDDQESSSFEVFALEPARPRRVTVTHQALGLAGSALVRGDEAGPIVLKLRPWGTISGRVVDDEGRPRRDIGILSLDQLGDRRPGAGKPDEQGTLPPGKFGTTVRLGDDGRFRFEGLVPGLKYGGYAIESSRGIGVLFEGLMVQPGEVRDLGDRKVRPDRPGPK